ncbi:type II toxin-antitoxin system PemK/MazF family toxin [Microbacterium aquilitoris]|uniref:Type II toxin-antitoxin system PemK/MazF family toxin n=1 Tax=Microbacterium aquilitoris TaxID=3067307 RepID=A0ABU3GKV6_9MICO|nr:MULTISPECIES: type II toxin-antitoxin system PemK/MazF family toxin [unclassified Microbacterium]MDT3331337.1 type II toxin-antitoxin system PemK/MazF family toxin [Microbacterium sp. KSW-18]MDT3343869.1 type II toxin-antitoxin system PemK/MazF family toxin [Microbacterium sp. KSW2-22]
MASRLISALVRLFRSSPDTTRPAGTVRVMPGDVRDLRISYRPESDGDPDAGEIVWTWVPFDEADGRGKDRPVLVIGQHGRDRLYAVRLTSKPHDRDGEHLALGSGEWDASGRPSWIDLGHLYSVPPGAMRREGAALDRRRFDQVAAALNARYSWSV